MSAQPVPSKSWLGTLFSRNNVLQLIGMAAVGAGAMYFWDYSVRRNQQHLVEQEIAEQMMAPAVDVHGLGLHGAWSDPGKDGLEPLRGPEEQKQIDQADAEARKIFSTPGGMYTQDDIRKNGKQGPFERFHAYQFRYNQRPFPKQFFDPISKTRTSPIFNWYVGGRLYHFAGVPTLEEFVIRAKKSTAPLPPPDTFIEPGTVICDEPDEDDKAEIERNRELQEKLKARAAKG